MLKAVIFDLNGVFVKGPKLTERLRDDFGVSEVESLAALKDVMGKVRLPNAGDVYLHWKSYLDRWNITLSRDEFLEYWFGSEKLVPEMEVLARQLKDRGLRIFILSNNFAERTDYYHNHFPILDEIAEKIYYSWQTGFKKDNPAAYQRVLTENNLNPEECIFFDDSEENVKLAERLGITSYLFQGVEDAKSKLNLRAQ